MLVYQRVYHDIPMPPSTLGVFCQRMSAVSSIKNADDSPSWIHPQKQHGWLASPPVLIYVEQKTHESYMLILCCQYLEFTSEIHKKPTYFNIARLKKQAAYRHSLKNHPTIVSIVFNSHIEGTSSGFPRGFVKLHLHNKKWVSQHNMVWYDLMNMNLIYPLVN